MTDLNALIERQERARKDFWSQREKAESEIERQPVGDGEVTQADRDAAAGLAEECNPEEADVLVPYYTNGGDSPLASAFARHRRAAEQRAADRERERCVQAALAVNCPTAAQAIRQTAPRKPAHG